MSRPHFVAFRIGFGGVEHMVGPGNDEAFDVFVLFEAFADSGDGERNAYLAVFYRIVVVYRCLGGYFLSVGIGQ